MKTETTAKPGTRIHWAGDTSNDPNTCTVLAVDGGVLFVRWDGETAAKTVPAALLACSPRWKIVG